MAVAVVAVAVVIHDDHQVARAVVLVGSVEGEGAPTLRAVEVAGIDHDGRGGVEQFEIAAAAEGRLGGGLQPDGAVGLGGHGGGVVEVVLEAHDGHGTANFSLVDDGLGEGVSVVVVDGIVVGSGGRALVANHNRHRPALGSYSVAGNGDVVDVEVVVATAPDGLGVEGNLDGLAQILAQVDNLVLVGGAGKSCVRELTGVGLAGVLPDGGVGSRPGIAAIGRDDDHKGLRGVGVAIGVGQGSVAVVGESNVELELCRGGVAQVDVGSKHPGCLVSAVDVLVVVTGGQTVFHSAGISPLRCGEGQRSAGEDLGGFDAGGTAPADIAAEVGAEVFIEREGFGVAIRGHGNAGGHARIGGGAVGRHIVGVGCIGGKACDGVCRAGDAGGDGVALGVAHRVGGAAVHVVSPRQGDAVVCFGGGEVGDFKARGQFFEGEIIRIGVPCRGSGTLGGNGHIAAVAVVVRQIGVVLTPVGSAFRVHIDSVGGHEGAVVGRVGHHTHVEDGTISCRGGLGPESQAEVAHHIVTAHARQDDGLVRSICGRGAGRAIPIGATGAGVVCTADVGVILGAVVDTVPALGTKDRIGVAARGDAFEAVGVGQGGHQVALGADSDVDYRRSIRGRAVGHHTEGVFSVGRQAGDSVGRAGDAGGHGGDAVIHGVGSAGVLGIGPSQRDTVGGDVGGCQVGNIHARGDKFDGDVVDVVVTVVCAAGGAEIAESNVTAVAGVVVEVDRMFKRGRGVATVVDGVDRHEGRGIVQVAHHTDNQLIGGRSLAYPEVHAQGADVGVDLAHGIDAAVVEAQSVAAAVGV